MSVICWRCHGPVWLEFDYWCVDCDGQPPENFSAYWGA